MAMKRSLLVLAVIVLIASFGATMVFAQASGSFNASGTNAACAIGVGGGFNGGNAVELLTTYVQTSNGQGVTLLIRPSLVTGLFTDTKITTSVPSASADIGIEVCVSVDDKTDALLSRPCIVYDQRFQQISSNLFSAISALGGVCTNPTTGAVEECNFDLILSTLSAHSYDYVAQVPQGYHKITATWSVIGEAANNTANSHVESCVGPGVLTVTQTKVFKQNGTLSF